MHISTLYHAKKLKNQSQQISKCIGKPHVETEAHAEALQFPNLLLPKCFL